MKPRQKITRAETSRIAKEHPNAPLFYIDSVERVPVIRRRTGTAMKRIGVISPEMREVMRAPPNAKANAWNGVTVHDIMRGAPWRKPL